MATRKRLALSLIALLVVVAGVAGAVVWSTSSDGARGDLPDSVGDWVAEDSEAFLEGHGVDQDERDELLERTRSAYDYNSEQFSELFDGADVSTRHYSRLGEDEASQRLLVVEIDAEAGPVLPVVFDDPEAMRIAAPFAEVVERDGVQCHLRRTNPPLIDSDAGPEDLEPDSVLCQRTGSSRTIRVSGSHVTVDEVVSMTNELWDR